jgi:hypothetical protein
VRLPVKSRHDEVERMKERATDIIGFRSAKRRRLGREIMLEGEGMTGWLDIDRFMRGSHRRALFVKVADARGARIPLGVIVLQEE